MKRQNRALLLTGVLVIALAVSIISEIQASQANRIQTLWQASYFDNMSLDGTPTMTRQDARIDMNWLTAAPDRTLPRDSFSVRWEAEIEFETGNYRFTASADDGIRIRIGDAIILDAFTNGNFRTFTRNIYLDANTYPVIVEYFEDTGMATVFFDWEPIGTVENIVSLRSLIEDTTDTVVGDTPQSAALPPRAFVNQRDVPMYDMPHENTRPTHWLHIYQSYDVVTVSEDGQWGQLQLNDDILGWVQTDFLTLREAVAVDFVEQDSASERQTQAPTATTEVSLNVSGEALVDVIIWEAPHQLSRLATIPAADEFRILARHSDDDWFFVSWGTENRREIYVGWVFAPSVRLTSGSFYDLPIR